MAPMKAMELATNVPACMSCFWEVLHFRSFLFKKGWLLATEDFWRQGIRGGCPHGGMEIEQIVNLHDAH